MDFYKQQAEEFINMKRRQTPDSKLHPKSWQHKPYYESVEPDREFLAYTEKLNPFRSKEVQLSLDDLAPERKDLF